MRSRRRRRRPGAIDGRPRRHGTGRRRSPSGSTTNRMPGSRSTPTQAAAEERAAGGRGARPARARAAARAGRARPWLVGSARPARTPRCRPPRPAIGTPTILDDVDAATWASPEPGATDHRAGRSRSGARARARRARGRSAGDGRRRWLDRRRARRSPRSMVATEELLALGVEPGAPTAGPRWQPSRGARLARASEHRRGDPGRTRRDRPASRARSGHRSPGAC